MPRQNIMHLRRSLQDTLSNRALIEMEIEAGFETKQAAQAEERLRLRNLKKHHKPCRIEGLGRRTPKQLYKHFRRCQKHERLPRSAASPRSMFRVRRNLIPWLLHLQLTETPKVWNGRQNPAFVTLLPRSPLWSVRGDDLYTVDPRRLLEQVRVDLTRIGGVPQDGWGFFGLHGEHCDVHDMWHIHIHSVVAGSLIDRVRSLKAKRKYRVLRERRSPSKKRGSTAVRISRQPTRNRFRRTAYCLQAFWPVARLKRRNRIPEPRHSQWLMWIDRYQPSDLCLLVGIKVENGRLVRTGKLYMNGKNSKK